MWNNSTRAVVTPKSLPNVAKDGCLSTGTKHGAMLLNCSVEL